MHLLQEYIFTHEIRFSTFNNNQKYVINVIFYPLIKYKLINLRNLILNFSYLDFINQFTIYQRTINIINLFYLNK